MLRSVAVPCFLAGSLLVAVAACGSAVNAGAGDGATPPSAEAGADTGPTGSDGRAADAPHPQGPDATGDVAVAAETGSPSDAPRDSTPIDAADDAAPVNLDAGTTVVVMQPVSGTPTPTTATLHGPGLVLMGGGTDVDQAFVWMHDTLAGSATTKLGNVVVLRADVNTDNAYTPYIYGLAPFQSVMTVFLGGYSTNGPTATAADLAIAAYYVGRSDAVFFAGGDQADYATWKGSPLMAAVAGVYARGGVIGGTSAGCEILGPNFFDSQAADSMGNASVATSDAVGNPFEPTLSFTHGMLTFPTLPGVFTDMHFVTRDRLGRLAAFVARQYADGIATSGLLGVGVDESNALLVDKTGKATLVQQPGGSQASTGTGAYVLQPAGPADTCVSGQPLLYKNVKVTRIATPATDSVNFTTGCAAGTQFTLTVNGATPSSPYSVNPYSATGTATTCP